MDITDTVARYVLDISEISETEEKFIEYYKLDLPETKKSQNEMLRIGLFGSLRLFMRKEHIDIFLVKLRACDGVVDAGNHFQVPIPLKFIEQYIMVPLTGPKTKKKIYIQVSIIDIDEYNKELKRLRGYHT